MIGTLTKNDQLKELDFTERNWVDFSQITSISGQPLINKSFVLSSISWIKHPTQVGKKCVLLVGSFKEEETYLSLALYAIEYTYDSNKPAESRFSDFKVVLSNVSEYVNNISTWSDLQNISFSGESEDETKLSYLKFKVVTFKQLKYYTF